jgi:hypothetical protein
MADGKSRDSDDGTAGRGSGIGLLQFSQAAHSRKSPELQGNKGLGAA